MFAPRKNPNNKKLQKPVNRKPVFKNNRLMVVNRQINKKASMRTLQPFVCCHSQSQKNSFQRSLAGSQSNYERYMNETEQLRRSNNCQEEKLDLQKIDELMKQILETIRKEKTEVSMKIMKMKARNIENRKNELLSNSVQKKQEGTSTNQSMESSLKMVKECDRDTQTYNGPQFDEKKKLIRQKLNSMGLDFITIPESVLYGQENSNYEIQINKIILSMLLNWQS